MWGDQLRRADERCTKFRQEASTLTNQNHKLVEDVKLLQQGVTARDSEIARL